MFFPFSSYLSAMLQDLSPNLSSNGVLLSMISTDSFFVLNRLIFWRSGWSFCFLLVLAFEISIYLSQRWFAFMNQSRTLFPFVSWSLSASGIFLRFWFSIFHDVLIRFSASLISLSSCSSSNLIILPLSLSVEWILEMSLPMLPEI
jgi:hypothetical protein